MLNCDTSQYNTTCDSIQVHPWNDMISSDNIMPFPCMESHGIKWCLGSNPLEKPTNHKTKFYIKNCNAENKKGKTFVEDVGYGLEMQ